MTETGWGSDWWVWGGQRGDGRDGRDRVLE